MSEFPPATYENISALDPAKIMVAGDWHGEWFWGCAAIRQGCALLDDPKVIVVLGDFGIGDWGVPGKGRKFLDRIGAALEKEDAWLFFIDGNHEDFTYLDRRLPHGTDGIVPLRERLYWASRGSRWRWQGKTWLALGGAVSLDRKIRKEGRDWWAQEAITPEQAAHAAQAPADVMITHDCVAAETLVATRNGFIPIADLVGKETELLVPDPAFKGNSWKSVRVHGRGVQRLYEVTLTRNGTAQQKAYVTAGHRWLVRRRSGDRRRLDHAWHTTYGDSSSLREGDRIPCALVKSFGTATLSPVGIMAGITYGDGTIREDSANVDLYGPKKDLLSKFSGMPFLELSLPSGETFYQVRCLPRFFKDLPPIQEARSYLAGWLAGYIATDGHVTADHGSITLYSKNESALERARNIAMILGLGTGSIHAKQTQGYNGISNSFVLSFWRETFPQKMLLRKEHRENFTRTSPPRRIEWTVTKIKETNRVEEVYCPVVPGSEAFVIEGNILTGNCPSGVVHSFGPPPSFWDPRDMARSDAHRELLQKVCEQVKPRWLLHGHLHRRYFRVVNLGWGTVEVTGLDCAGKQGNWVILDTRTMQWTELDDKPERS